jgi:hypothetical protein
VSPSGRAIRIAVPFFLDLLLLGALLLLLSPRLTGLPLHEWLGLSLGLPLVAHLLYSWPWIATNTRRLARQSDRRARVNYVLNALLFALIVVVLTSGIAISQVALPSVGLHTIEDRSWRALHNQSLNWLVLLTGLHLAMNWTALLAGLRRHVGRDAAVRE